jgi:hypothetical protein
MRTSNIESWYAPMASGPAGTCSSTGPAPTGPSPCTSTPGSGTWNDADRLKMTSPCCSATTWREENDRPSRSRSTRRIVGMSERPGRRK